MRRPVSLILTIILLITCSGCFWGDRGGAGEHDHEGSGEQHDHGGSGEHDHGGEHEEQH